MVMQNKIIKVHPLNKIHIKFDLKGSMVNRDSLPENI